jgi:hypothetical protein
VQKAYEDEFLSNTDRMLFSRVEDKNSIVSTSMFNAIAASKDAFSFQDHDKKGELGALCSRID